MKPDDAGDPDASLAVRERVWLFSASAALRGRIQSLIEPLAGPIRLLPGIWDKNLPGLLTEIQPALIMIDIAHDMNQGLRILRTLKRSRNRAPIVVLTEDFSKEFAAKILSEGIRYYFSHDFCERELLELAGSLLAPDQDSDRCRSSE